MKRKILIVITCFMAFGLASCTLENENDSQVESASTSEIVQITETEEVTTKKEDVITETEEMTTKEKDVITEEKALEAIEKYCYADNPDLRNIIDSGEYQVYWTVETKETDEIVVLFRSYTGAIIHYYIDPDSGETYVTEFVPGITDDEQRTNESFNVRDYLDE